MEISDTAIILGINKVYRGLSYRAIVFVFRKKKHANICPPRTVQGEPTATLEVYVMIGLCKGLLTREATRVLSTEMGRQGVHMGSDSGRFLDF